MNRTARFSMKLFDYEHAWLETMAQRDGMSMASVVRRLVRWEAERRELDKRDIGKAEYSIVQEVPSS